MSDQAQTQQPQMESLQDPQASLNSQEMLVDFKNETDLAKIEAKKKQFEELLQKQQQDRELQKEQKKVRDETTKDPKERMLTIQKEFRLQYENLQGMLKKFNKATSNVEEYFTAFKQLKDYFVASNYALTTFDKQQYKEQLEKMEKTIFQARDLSRPRKKFRFSSKIPTAAEAGQAANTAAEVVSAVHTIKDFGAEIPGIVGVSSQTITINSKETNPYFSSNEATIRLVDIKDCTIYLNGLFDTIYINNIENSTICIGPVRFSLLIDQVKNSTLSFCAHQVRIHNSSETRFSLFSTSKCIIEHCSQLTFTPYAYSYDGYQSDFASSGMSGKDNLWREIQDFNWLKQEASPNFTLEEQAQEK